MFLVIVSAILALGLIAYGVVSLAIILYFHSDVTTALTPKLPQDSYEDQVVWITGAGSGLGEQLALALAKGSRAKLLILSSRKQDQLERVAAQCRERILAGSGTTNNNNNTPTKMKIEILPLDLSDLESIPEKVQQACLLAEKEVGTKEGPLIDVLINAAGVTTRSFASDSDFELDHYVAKVNYLGPVCLIKQLLVRQCLPTLIIQLGSIASKMGAPVRSAYSGSKFALQGWLEALGVESVIQQRQLHILNCILGSIDTGLGSRALVNVTPEGKIETLQEVDSVMAQGLPHPDHVAERILAVAHAKKVFETWMAPNHELLPILYFVTYARHTAFLVLTKLVGRKYAITKTTSATEDKTAIDASTTKKVN